MNLGTIVYEHEIYNLDYMTDEELKQLIQVVEDRKKTSLYELKNTKQYEK